MVTSEARRHKVDMAQNGCADLLLKKGLPAVIHCIQCILHIGWIIGISAIREISGIEGIIIIISISGISGILSIIDISCMHRIFCTK
jgi:hypothetical protein